MAVMLVQSHPTWVRGLKLEGGYTPRTRRVAPYVGAWIETLKNADGSYSFVVAPYVGAWIETIMLMIRLGKIRVAPYVGAWIETS